VTRPRLLDLFCGAGGAAMGYHQAGFDVVGVDIRPQPHYPFEFYRDDALDWLAQWQDEGRHEPGWGFDAIHASPPCQAYTTMSNRWRGAGGTADAHESLIAPTRELLQQTGLPWVIENVPGAKPELRSPVVINGASVDLPRLDRPRLFESNVLLLVPQRKPAKDAIGVYGKCADGRLLFRRQDGSEQRAAESVKEACEVMGIDWTREWDEIREAIPPAYTELIGHQLLQHIRVAA
jgi:DNA (cytosine-5)-methyltransferase 1